MKKNTKRCEVCGRELPLSAFSKSYRNRCRECVAAQVRSERQNKRTEESEECSVKQSPIDWEQRRYEIAKNVLPTSLQIATRVLSSGGSIGGNNLGVICAEQAVLMADALIAELKKGGLK